MPCRRSFTESLYGDLPAAAFYLARDSCRLGNPEIELNSARRFRRSRDPSFIELFSLLLARRRPLWIDASGLIADSLTTGLAGWTSAFMTPLRFASLGPTFSLVFFVLCTWNVLLGERCLFICMIELLLPRSPSLVPSSSPSPPSCSASSLSDD